MNIINLDVDIFKQNFFISKEIRYKYGEINTPFFLIHKILDLIDEYEFTLPNKKWLDIGTGTGYFSILLYKRLFKGLENKIKNPIERIFEASASLLTTYKNSKVANLYGAEIEFIFNMANLSQHLEDVSLGFNTSLMKTQVEIAQNNQLENAKTRELQGASNWVINADAKYEFNFSKEIKNTLSVVYGVKGKNIYSVGTAGLDHIYEMPFHKLDLVCSTKLTKNLNVKFTADNILNPAQRFELGNNNRTAIVEESLVVKDYKKGVGLSLNLTYTF